MTDYTKLDALIGSLGIDYKADFVPFSKSRNADDKQPSINWLVSLTRGKFTLRADYMQGSGHLPKAVRGATDGRTVYDAERIAQACETGRQPMGARLSPPALRDVLYSLVMDASALDAGSFEDWASDFGYDTDSRKAEAIYQACIAIALKLRQLLGDATIAELASAFQDY